MSMSINPTPDRSAAKPPHIVAAKTPDGPQPGRLEPVTLPMSFLEAVSVVSAYRGAFDHFEDHPDHGPMASWHRTETNGQRPRVRVLVDRSAAEDEFAKIEIEHRESPTDFAFVGDALLRSLTFDFIAAAEFDGDASCTD